MNNAHFTLAYWCLLVAAMLPIVCAGIAKSGTLACPCVRAATTTTTPGRG